MNEAFLSDWKALGLDFHSPFDILSKPRAVANTAAAPKKRGPKKNTRERTLASLLDPGEAKPSHFNMHIATRAEVDRTRAIAGGAPV